MLRTHILCLRQSEFEVSVLGCVRVQTLLDEGVINEIAMGQGTLICASKGIQDDFVATWKMLMQLCKNLAEL